MIIRQHAPTKLLLGIPVCMAIVFILDVIGPLGPVVGVLYLPLIMISSRVVSSAGVVYSGLTCLVMAFASFILSGVDGFELLTIYQLGVLSSAIVLTTVASILVMSSASKDSGVPD